MEVENINLLGLLQIHQPRLGQSPRVWSELSQAQPGLGPGLNKFVVNIVQGGWAKGNMFYFDCKQFISVQAALTLNNH